jgi:hypothetical protein
MHHKCNMDQCFTSLHLDVGAMFWVVMLYSLVEIYIFSWLCCCSIMLEMGLRKMYLLQSVKLTVIGYAKTLLRKGKYIVPEDLMIFLVCLL